MTELIAVVFMMFLGFIAGIAETEHTYQEKCVAKYAEMPHNKVEDFCKTLLKFEKDPK
jgi:hypothetical protein